MIDNLKFIDIDMVKKEVSSALSKSGQRFVNFDYLKKENLIFNDEVIQDYIKLMESIKRNIINHSHSLNLITRNFQITKDENIDLILSILQQEAH